MPQFDGVAQKAYTMVLFLTKNLLCTTYLWSRVFTMSICKTTMFARASIKVFSYVSHPFFSLSWGNDVSFYMMMLEIIRGRVLKEDSANGFQLQASELGMEWREVEN